MIEHAATALSVAPKEVSIEHITIALSSIALVTILCQWFAWWVKLPSIIFLLLMGLFMGPVTHWLNPDQIFADLLFPMVSLSVAIILFEGSLTLKFSEIRGRTTIIRNIVSFGYAITLIGGTLLAHFLFKLPWQLSVLFGAVTGIGGPTVVAPILRSVRLKPPLNQILRWESILIDPIGALVSVLAFGIVSSSLGNGTLTQEFSRFAEVIALGSIIGVAAAFGLAQCFKRQLIPEYLHNIATLSTVLCIYTITSLLSDGGGLLSVTIMGIALANMKDLHMEEILNFKESLSVLLISGLFIVLAARINFYGDLPLVVPCIIAFIAMQFIIRPITVWVSSIGSELNWREKFMLSWICPRGIVCAAVASLFSFKLSLEGYHAAAPFVFLTFTIIMSTVLFQSATAKIVASSLGLYRPDPRGILIIGANIFARKLAQAFNSAGISTLLIDNNWDNIAKAKLDGLDAYFGNPLSQDIMRYIPFSSFGQLLALTPNHEFNMLCCLHYQSDFGRNHVHTLKQSDAREKSKIESTPDRILLFNPPKSYTEINQLLTEGSEFKINTLTAQYTLEELQEQKKSINLAAIDPKGKTHPFTTKALPCGDGWTIITLPIDEEEPAKEEEEPET